MSDSVDVAIVGAGPYGLSLAAHLRAAGVSFRQFGQPMGLWRASMPRGMVLKSHGFATNLSSPDAGHTLEAFCAATGRPYGAYGIPIPLDTFVAYGLWFAQELVPDLEETLVTEVVPKDDSYDISLANGDQARARNVVVATGVQHFAAIPEQLAGLPTSACTHSSAHADLSTFRGRRVIVLGAGQSAIESAALLHENGAGVQVVARAPKLAWNGPPLPPDRSLMWRLREPISGIGTGPGHWFYARHPELFRRLPEATRVHKAQTVLGPACAHWLSDRISGQFPILLGQTLAWARTDGDGVRLGLDGPDGSRQELTADHVIAATGYRPDLRRLTFLADELRGALRTLAGTAAVDRHYQSSVPGLYFIGPAVTSAFGPLMRFVCGSDTAARTVTRHLVRATGRRALMAVGAGR